MKTAIAVLVLLSAACASAPEPPPVRPRLEPDATPVDLLLLSGELRGVRPGTDMQRVLAAFPELSGRSTGVAQAGILSGPMGLAITTERSGGRVQTMWFEFAGNPMVPATALTSRDGRLRAGAGDADVAAWLAGHGLPLLVRELRAEDAEEPVPWTVVREYFIDSSLAFLVTVDGLLQKGIVANRHVYGAGRGAVGNP